MTTATAHTTTALQRAADSQLAAHSLKREQIDILKQTICKGASDAELALFLEVCKAKRLDPFSGQIHAVKRKERNQDTNSWEERLSWQVGIDGFRALAERTGDRDGMDPPEWCGDDGRFVQVWLEKKPPRACRVRVYRKGVARPYEAIALWDFYVQTKSDGNPNRMWARGGPAMLAKCAEALALRMAFPLDLADLYAPEEMDAAGVIDVVPFAAPPPTVGQIVEPVAPPQLPPAAAGPRTPPTAKQLSDLLLAAKNEADLVACTADLAAMAEGPEKQQLRQLYADVKRKLAKSPPPGVPAAAPAPTEPPPAQEPYDGPPEDLEQPTEGGAE